LLFELSRAGEVVEYGPVVLAFNSELCPESIEIHSDRLVFHFFVKLREDRHTRGAITGAQSLLQFPILCDVSTRKENAPQGVLQTLPVVGPAVNFHVGEQTEERPSPVRPAPGMRVIEPLVTRRFSLTPTLTLSTRGPYHPAQ